MQISDVMEIKPLIYRFIPYIRVLEPAWLNKELKDEISNFAEGL